MENQESVKVIEEYRVLYRNLIIELGNKFDFDITKKTISKILFGLEMKKLAEEDK